MQRLRIALFAIIAALAALGAHAETGLPQRIISVAPSITEVLYGVGAFDRVVAVSDYCTYPPAVKNLPRVGGWQDSSLEKVAALHPDLVILTDAQAPFLEDKLRQLGLQFTIVPTRSIDDVYAGMARIGRAVGRDAQASELARNTRAALDAVRSRARNAPRRRVLFVVDRTPGTLRDLYVATEGSFLAELIAIAGGSSVAAPSRSGYEKISKEAVLTLNPEIVIDMVQGTKGRFGENPETVWRDLPDILAVRNSRIYPVRDEFVPHASQFVADTARLFLRLIHPEIAQPEIAPKEKP